MFLFISLYTSKFRLIYEHYGVSWNALRSKITKNSIWYEYDYPLHCTVIILEAKKSLLVSIWYVTEFSVIEDGDNPFILFL